MTVSYSRNVATAGYCTFFKLLKRWRASIYKLIYKELMIFLALYYLLNLSYRFLMTKEQKLTFEAIVDYCSSGNGLIPITFVLGFYVGLVMKRWWEQYLAIAWPDSIAVYVSGHVRGQDENGRMMRRIVMRYVCLCLTMVFTMVSPNVKRRFPTLDHFVEAGLLNDSEKKVFDTLDDKFPMYPKHWLPIVWACSIMIRARKEGRIWDDYSLQTIVAELNKFRGQAGFLLFYDFISVPLVYTQVVTWAVYSYSACSIVGRQALQNETDAVIDMYFPIFATLEFFFYVGWLKVAESLICPFGDDDDDFELNWMIDRNLQISYLIVDEMHQAHPDLVKDQYWDEVFPIELPYATDDAIREQPPEPSTAKLKPVESVQSIFRRGSKVRYTPSTGSVRSERGYRPLSSVPSVELIDERVIRVSSSTKTPARESLPETRRSTLEELPPDEEQTIDYFELLKAERARERALRHRRRVNQSISRNHPLQAENTEYNSLSSIELDVPKDKTKKRND